MNPRSPLWRLVCGAGALAVTSLVGSTARATPPPSCRFTNVTPLSFGAYRAGQQGPVDTVGEIDVTCTAAMTVQISLSRSSTGKLAPRAMTARGLPMMYDLFLDAAHTLIWGDGTQGTQSLSAAAPAGQALRLSIYGRIFGFQAIPAGTYTDRIVVVVTY